jgi:hypothetical protein
MQRTNGNSTVTTPTNTGVVTSGLVIVGANAVRMASQQMPADSKRSDHQKPGAFAHRLHEASGWRYRAPNAPRFMAAERYPSCSASVLPPRLWASWVISQSLCG